jgi:hypothetical protein
MRTDVKLATLSLAVLLGACSKREDQATGLSEDLKKDLAVASASASEFATAPSHYQPMRFVSAVEQARASTPAKRTVATKRRTKPVRRPEATAKPAPEVVEEPSLAAVESPAPSPAPEAVPTAPTPEPVVIAQQPAGEPAPVPVGTGGGEGDAGMGARRSGGGLGGLLGGIIGAVVIRGGRGGVDHCDPRTDGRQRPPIFDRPDFGLPLPTGQRFPLRRR